MLDRLVRRGYVQRRRAAGGATLPGDLHDRLQSIKERGFETMDSLQTHGVGNISAPILALDGHALAALTCPDIQPVNANAPSHHQVIAFVRRPPPRFPRRWRA